MPRKPDETMEERQAGSDRGIELESLHHHAIGDQIRFSNEGPFERVVARFHGGFGAVYVVESTDELQPGITVLKTVRKDLASSRVLEAFYREAQTWYSLSSLDRLPILPAFAVVRYNHLPYVRTSYIPSLPHCDGPSVEHLLRVSVLSPQFAHQLFYQLASVLGQLAELGYCHGDVKPSNMLLRDITSAFQNFDARVNFSHSLLLSDFGLARAAVSSEIFGGDIRYIAPEALTDGNINSIAADVFSYGASMFHMLFRAPIRIRPSDRIPTADEINALLKANRPDLPLDIGVLVVKCLNSTPGDRPSFATICAELERLGTFIGISYSEVRGQHDKAWTANITADRVFVPYLTEQKGLTTGQAEDITHRIVEAASLRAGLHLEQADALLNSVLEKIPDFPTALAGLAHSCILRRLPRRAMNLYMRSIAGYAKDKALLQIDQKCYAGACSTYGQCAAVAWPDLSPHDRSLTAEIAEVCAKAGCEYGPQDAKAWLSLGMVQLIIRSDAETALATLQTAYSLDPRLTTIRLYIFVARLVLVPEMDGAAIKLMAAKLDLQSTQIEAGIDLWRQLRHIRKPED